ncbi:MAG: dTDP-4-dehydrorhamnose reductase [Patescibacteria group bacterium]|jgi:dTDP-4-dehydrorhamnose reductase
MDKNTTIVLFGGNGMLGRALQVALTGYHLISLKHYDVDITNKTKVLEKISEIKPDIIINAAAYTKVDDCETNQEIAMLVNGRAPEFIAQAARAANASLVHYSTDYVFSGTKPTGYSETDQPDKPVNVYGASKLAGERAVQQWEKSYIIRTAWLYGQHGPNFVDTMLKLADSKPELTVVNDQHGSPTYVVDLAEATLELLESNQAFGIYHRTNNGTCTWYEFAQEIFKQTKRTIMVKPCASEAFPRPAHRPNYSILLNTKLPALRSWQDALADYLATSRG